MHSVLWYTDVIKGVCSKITTILIVMNDNYIKIIFIIMKTLPKMTSKSVLFQFGGLPWRSLLKGKLIKPV